MRYCNLHLTKKLASVHALDYQPSALLSPSVSVSKYRTNLRDVSVHILAKQNRYIREYMQGEFARVQVVVDHHDWLTGNAHPRNNVDNRRVGKARNRTPTISRKISIAIAWAYSITHFGISTVHVLCSLVAISFDYCDRVAGTSSTYSQSMRNFLARSDYEFWYLRYSSWFWCLHEFVD